MRAEQGMIPLDSRREVQARTIGSEVQYSSSLGEALRHRPHMDNAARVEAMGSHFEPDLTGWKWPQKNRHC